jgi:hypothetical protein
MYLADLLFDGGYFASEAVRFILADIKLDRAIDSMRIAFAIQFFLTLPKNLHTLKGGKL